MTDFNLNDPAPGDDARQTNAIVSQLHGAGGQQGGEEFDLTMATGTSRSLPLQAMAVGLVLIVAAGSLFLMRRQGTRAGIDFSNTNVVTAVDTSIKKVENEKEILAALETRPPEQVPKEKVPDSPFRINKLGDSGDSGSRGGVDPARYAEERRRVEIQEALGKLQVESVMHGRVPIAKISGKLFRVGDSVGGLFTLERIEDRSVFLAVDDKEYELSMVK